MKTAAGKNSFFSQIVKNIQCSIVYFLLFICNCKFGTVNEHRNTGTLLFHLLLASFPSDYNIARNWLKFTQTRVFRHLHKYIRSQFRSIHCSIVVVSSVKLSLHLSYSTVS